MRQYPMSLSSGVKVLSALVVVLLCALPLVVWSVVPGFELGGSRGPAGAGIQEATR
jgi:ABC-type cobalt transport system substrate-binding protein